MLLEWLTREGLGLFVSWWLLIAAAGAAAFPLCYRLLGGLPDRGYTAARAVGVLLTAFVFWMMASLGLVANTPGAMLLAWLVVLGISVLAFARMPEQWPWRSYWRENRGVIITAELLFAGLLLGWMIFRAQYPDTGSTEKPMDLMFITSIMTSPTFPPNDGWMAGYSISYYYFGYVMAAMLSTLSGVNSTTGFSMTLASWFALTGLGAFGVVCNLVRVGKGAQDRAAQSARSQRSAVAAGLLGVFFVLIMSNWQFVFVELPWQTGQGNAAYYNFWATQARLGDPPRAAALEAALSPDRWDNWWWFRASRVLNDFQLDGSLPPQWYAQPIDEFPAFSFLLGDTHPHVLALPFGMMALVMSLNVLLARRNPSLYELIFYAVTIGSMVFLNTWDVLAYVGAFVGAGAVRRMMRRDTGRLSWEDIASMVGDIVVFVGVTLLAYGLFLYSFRSQAGGITVNLLYPTYFPHFLLMFGTFALILLAYLLVEARRGGRRMAWGRGLSAAGLLLLVVGSVTVVGVVVLALRPDVQNLSRQFIEEAGGWQAVLSDLVMRRVTYLPVTLLMLGFIVLIAARLFARWVRHDGRPTITYTHSSAFAMLLTGVGAVLVVTPEFVYLVDVFSSRINTIFKFYYQAWAVWGVASAYACYSLLADADAYRPPRWARGAMAAVLGVMIVGGSLYLAFGVYARAVVEPFTTGNGARFYGMVNADTVVTPGQRVRAGDLLVQSASGGAVVSQQDGVVVVRDGGLFVRSDWTVDGGRFMVTADDYRVLQCLRTRALPGEIAVEAIGQAYNPQYGRVASLAGVPVLLGWENHQRQWRGATYGEIVGTRPQDIARLYTDMRWDVAAEILARYGIDYVMYGAAEIQQYGVYGREKFVEALPVACASGESTIFRVPSALQLR